MVIIGFGGRGVACTLSYVRKARNVYNMWKTKYQKGKVMVEA